jgi:hypothetical protein
VSVYLYEPPMPIQKSCTYCHRPLVVTGYWQRGMVFCGEREWIYAHAADLSTECVRTLTDTVRPYDGWGTGDQVEAEQRRRYAEEDARLEAEENAT